MSDVDDGAVNPRPDEIQALQGAYGWWIDNGGTEELADLFTPTGTFRVEPGIKFVSGRAELLEFARNSPPGVHLCGQAFLLPDSTTRTAWIFTSAGGRLTSGYYTDRYARDDAGALRFADRTVTISASVKSASGERAS